MYKVAAGVFELFRDTYAEVIRARTALSRCGGMHTEYRLLHTTGTKMEFMEQLAKLSWGPQKVFYEGGIVQFVCLPFDGMYVDITSPASIQLALNCHQVVVDKKLAPMPLFGRDVLASVMDHPLQVLDPGILRLVVSDMKAAVLDAAPATLSKLKEILPDKEYESVFYAMMAHLVNGLVEKDKLGVVEAIVRAHPEWAPHVMAHVVASPKWQPYAEGQDEKIGQAQLAFLKFMEPYLSRDSGWRSFFAEGSAQVRGLQAPASVPPARFL